jgi:colanic acid/amylovoran biosynthesis glycosyltransferase
LIHDIHIWTSKDLDYLHFGFGNLLLGREYYGLVMGCKTSVSFRGSDINVFPVRHKISYNSALNLVSKVQVNSMELLDKLCLQNSEVSTKSVIIHPGLQRSFVTNNAEMESFMAIRKLNTRPEIISVGRLHWIKGYELALAALKLFKKQGNDFNYTIVGDGTEREKLAYLIRHYELEDNVHLALSLNTTEIRVLLERSNLFIQTSWAEGFSNSTLEAQALGVPAVVTPVSGMSSIVEHRKSGFISEDFTPEGVLKGLEWYNRLTSEELGILSRETSLYIQERFSYDKLKQNWLQFFN